MRIIILVVLVTISQFAYANNTDFIQHTVTVTGEGYIDVEPDIVDLSFSLTAMKPSLKEAKQVVDGHYNQALAVLKRYKIDRKDITLTMLNSRPEHEWVDRQKIFKGHRVSRSLNVTVRKLSIYPDLLQALVEADISELNQVKPYLADESNMKRKAMQKAVSVAKEKAKFLAIEFNRQLGKVIQINEGVVAMPSPVLYRQKGLAEASQAAAPPAMFGSQRVSANITAVFSLK